GAERRARQLDPPGIDYAGRRESDDQRAAGAGSGAGGADPVHAPADDARKPARERPGSRRGRRAGQVREATMSQHAIEQAIADIRAGKLVIVADDESRENEGDLVGAAEPATVPADLRRPGHVFPLRARPGGVLQRVGQTEASVDLARLAGLYPAGVICEILNPDGSMARRPDLERFAERHGLTFITVA